MSEYDVVLKDADGCDICTDIEYGLVAAKRRAMYLLSDDHTRQLGTTHEVLGTYKVEVQATRTGKCLWDAFR